MSAGQNLASSPGAYDVRSQADAHGSRAQTTTFAFSMTLAASCVDMDWGWQVEEVSGPKGDAALPIAYRLRTTFRRPDRETGEYSTGFGRWWEVPHDVTISGIIKTAFAAAKMILEHELMESFKWRNARVFDPHNTVQELAGLTGARWIDSIP